MRQSYPGLLAIGLGYAVWNDGGVVIWGWNVCLLILGLAAAAYWFLTPPLALAPPVEPWLGRVLFLLLAYVAMQSIPLPLFLVRIVVPARAQLADGLAAVMPRPMFVPLSVAPTTTFSYLLRTIAYVVTFLLIREITWRSRSSWPWITMIPLIAIGGAEAWVGILQNSPGIDVHGTYANRNHFAGLLEMILPGTVAFGIARFRKEHPRPGSVSGALESSFLFCIGAVILVGIIYSQSKMGLVATLCALFLMGALTLGVRLRSRKKWLVLAVLAGALAGALIFLPSDQEINGFGNVLVDDTTGEGRLPIAANTLHLIAAYPLFGVGLGNYGSAFVKYQTENVDAAFTDAHDDYLQLVAELGIAGFVLLASFTLPIFSKAVRAAMHAADPNTRYLGLGCAGGMAAISLHSLTDFNLYIPANAMVLAWLAGITAGLPPLLQGPVHNEAAVRRFPLKATALALSVLLIVFASGWLVFEDKFTKDPQAERLFCQLGICDIDSVMAAQTAARGGNAAAVPAAELMEAVRRDAVSPGRWSDLGQAIFKSGRIEQARQCFSNALTFGPNVPPLLLQAAAFYHGVGEDNRALELATHALAKTAVYETATFDWFAEVKLPVTEILSHGLPQDPRIFRAYLRYLKASGDASGAASAWDAILARGYADDELAREYVNFVYGNNEYGAAAQAWAAYLGERGHGYLKTNWVFNGDFEFEPSQLALDWSIARTDGIDVERDANVKHSGAQSLKIRFDGKQNLADAGVHQKIFVTPGKYRFETYIRTRDITTDQGIRLRIYDPAGTFHMEMPAEPLLGTNDWTRLSASICVVPRTKLLAVGLVRQPSLKFDNLLKGSLWVDSVSLSKIAQSCSA